LNRKFTADEPNKVWTTDITYVPTREGWPYAAVVIDWFSRQVVGWAIDGHLPTSWCGSAVQMAFLPTGHKGAENGTGFAHHPDWGSPYASHGYRKHLSIMKRGQGMGRRGNCWEGLPLGYNAPTERFFRSLKHEQLPYEKFRTKASAKMGIMGYLAFYNGKRSHQN
jgi:transposase InsO family protein